MLILILVLILILTLKLFSIVLVKYNEHSNNQIIKTSTIPIKNKTVILDAGHGYPDNGASSKDGITEANINLQIALKVQKLLEQSGSTVILTRTNENGIYDDNCKTIRQKKVSDIKNRVKIGNESGADIFVSIHLNKINESKYWGWQTFYKKNDENSKVLAECIQDSLGETIKKKNKRQALKIQNIYIVDNVKIPIVIVECGFLSNEEEKNLLRTDEYQNSLARGIYNGINNFFYQNKRIKE